MVTPPLSTESERVEWTEFAWAFDYICLTDFLFAHPPLKKLRVAETTHQPRNFETELSDQQETEASPKISDFLIAGTHLTHVTAREQKL